MAKRGRAGPQEILASRPRPYTHLTSIYEAFQRLSTCRQLGPGGEGRIPWTAINEYAYRYEFDDDDFERLTHFIEVLDGVYLSRPGASGTSGSKNKGSGSNGR